jgi:hypothetical protein
VIIAAITAVVAWYVLAGLVVRRGWWKPKLDAEDRFILWVLSPLLFPGLVFIRIGTWFAEYALSPKESEDK